jgi:hypothetical protein
MPNWCENILTIAHDDTQQIERVRLAIEEGRLCDEFIPYPFEKQEAPINPDNPDSYSYDPVYSEKGYDWCVEKWGTKWDICDSNLRLAEKNVLDARFLTASSPPIEVMRAMEAAGFKVTLKYVEYGMCFEGIYQNGHDDCWELEVEEDEDEYVSSYEEDEKKSEDVDQDYLTVYQRLYPSEASLDHLFVQPLSELEFWVSEPDPLATPLVPALFFVMNPEMPPPVSPLPVPQWISPDANVILKVD